MTRMFRLISITGVLCAAFQLSAQQLLEPPKLLRIFREDIKEGRDTAHEKTEAKFAQAQARIKYPANSLALVSMTGTRQAWFLESQESFASIAAAEAFFEKQPFKAEVETIDGLDAESHVGSRSWVAAYRPDMSYHAQQLVERLPKARYFNVIVVRIRPGTDLEFTELAKATQRSSLTSL
jgi:hypothetical protein